MSEFDGFSISKSELYRFEVEKINKEFDDKINKKSFLISKDSIEKNRQKKLDSIKKKFYPNKGSGFIE